MIKRYKDKKNVNVDEVTNKKETIITLFIFIQIQLLMESAPKGFRWSKETVVIGTFILTLFMFIYFCIYRKKKMNKNAIIFINSVIIVSLISMIVNNDFIGDNFVFITIIISSFFICNVLTEEEYLECYVNAMVIYAILSLLATYLILPMVMRGHISIFNTYTNFLGTPFIDVGVAFVVKWNGIMRNQGIFREPGVYQFFLLVALSIEMFYKKQTNNKKIILFIITLVTTFSTVGLICLIFILLLYMLTKRNKSSMKTIGVITVTLIVIAVIIKSDENLKDVIVRTFSKLSEGEENESFIVRFESIANLIKMSIHNILFGSSFVNGFNYIQDNYNSFNTNDITGTMISYIMALGYPIGIWININFYKFCCCLNKDRVISSIIFIILFASLNTQNLIYNSVIWVFILMPYMKKTNKVDFEYAKKN